MLYRRRKSIGHFPCFYPKIKNNENRKQKEIRKRIAQTNIK